MVRKSIAACLGCLALAGCVTVEPGPTASPPAETTDKNPTSESTVAAVRKYMQRNFGSDYAMADWYADIKGYGIEGKTLVLSTDYYNDADVLSPSSGMCRAASFYKTPKIDVIAVDDQDGRPIVVCGPGVPPQAP